MRRILSITLVLLIAFSMSVSVFAAEDDKTIDVYAKYESSTEGIYKDDIENGKATVAMDGMTVSVSGVTDIIKVLEIFPVPASESEALEWMGSKVSEHGILSHAYIITLVDANGNKTSAVGVTVTIICSHCNGDEIVVGLNTDGTATSIESKNGSFTANGNAYYIVAEKRQPSGITVPIRGDENEIHADVTIDNDTVELHELDFEEIDHIVGDHVNTGIVEIDLTELDEKITKIELPMASIKHIVEAAEEAHNDTEALQIDFPHGSVKLDDKTMRAIVEQAECNEVMLVLENVGETRLNDAQEVAIADWNVYGGYEAYLLCVASNKRISDFQGGVATLSVPFEIPTGLKAEKFSVWYVADDGKIEKLETWYENGKLCLDVSHFSDFIIVYEGDETPTTPGGGTSYGNDNNDNYTAPTYRNHKEDFGDVQVSLKHVDLNTGGEPLEVEVPAIVSIITTPDGKPEITDPRRGLADTTEDAKKDIEKDIPGVFEPEVVAPAPDDATESPSKSGGLFAGIALLLAALAVGGGYLYFRKRKEAES